MHCFGRSFSNENKKSFKGSLAYQSWQKVLDCNKANYAYTGGGEAEPSEGCSYLPRVALEKG